MAARSHVLVVAQFLCIALVLFGGSWTLPLWSWLLFGSGILLFFWATWALGRPNFTIYPEPNVRNVISQDGPYRVVRHPMYTSVLICGAAFSVGAPSMVRVVAFLGCIVVLFLKVRHEEALLAEKHPEYPARMKGIGRLLPFLWVS